MVASAAKKVDVSDDNGVTWFTLPGNTASLDREAGSLDDTVFGQPYSSTEGGLIGWTISSQAFYKGFAGYLATVKKQGTTTAATAEACTLETGQIYQIDDGTKEIWDRSIDPIVYDTAVDHSADVEWVDFLFGRVKFLDAYTVTGAVTVDVNYFPTISIGKGRSFTLTQTLSPIDTTDFATAQGNNGYRTFDAGLKTVALEIGSIFDVAGTFKTDLDARSEIIIELGPDGAGKSVARGFFRTLTHGQGGDVGALEEETIGFGLNVPAPTTAGVDCVERPFGWQHTNDTTLSTSVIKVLTAFVDGTKLDVRYMWDGAVGEQGDAVVVDVSLSGGVEVMNEFQANFQGDGAPATAP